MKALRFTLVTIIFLAACAPTDPQSNDGAKIATQGEAAQMITPMRSSSSAIARETQHSSLPSGNCRDLSHFAQEPWYEKTIAALLETTIKRQDHSDRPIDQQDLSVKATACLVRQQKQLIIAIGGGMCTSTYVYKADLSQEPILVTKVAVDNKTYFDSANVREAECWSALDPQGVIAGGVLGFYENSDGTLSLTGGIGFGGCGQDVYYEYDPASNIIELKKTFAECVEGMNVPDKWQEY
jgi:hypothetical protein